MVPSPEIRIALLPSAAGGGGRLQYANTFLVNDTVAVDAGSLGFNATPADQARVTDIVLTHVHADHIASLPFLLINRDGATCPRVWGTSETIDALKRHVFNDVIWPDLERIATPQTRFVEYRAFAPREPFDVAGLRFTAVPVDHTVPTVGLLVEASSTSVVLGGDSGPTDELWARAAELPNLAGVFLETSFPEAEIELADVSKHLTPRLFAEEVRKLPAGTPMFAVHFKPTHDAEIRAELAALGLPHLTLVDPGTEYVF